MAEQAISREDVEEVLGNADSIAPARLRRLNAYRNFKGWLVRVTYMLESGTIPNPEAITVITVYAEQRT